MCNGLGEIVLALGESEGLFDTYTIELLAGNLARDVVPETYVSPIDLGNGTLGFRLYWTDLPFGTRELAALDAVIGVSKVGSSGELSETAEISVSHPGGFR